MSTPAEEPIAVRLSIARTPGTTSEVLARLVVDREHEVRYPAADRPHKGGPVVVIRSILGVRVG